MTIKEIVQPFSAIASILLGSATREVEIGALVELTGGDHAGKQAFVQNIAISPYYSEEKVGTWRAYVYAADWNEPGADRFVDWVLLDELEVVG